MMGGFRPNWLKRSINSTVIKCFTLSNSWQAKYSISINGIKSISKNILSSASWMGQHYCSAGLISCSLWEFSLWEIVCLKVIDVFPATAAFSKWCKINASKNRQREITCVQKTFRKLHEKLIRDRLGSVCVRVVHFLEHHMHKEEPILATNKDNVNFNCWNISISRLLVPMFVH